MIFEYSQQKTFLQAVDVVDAGNMCLRCTTQEGFDYYVVTKTIFGKLHILKFGPVLEDAPMLLDGFIATYKKADYKEATIAKEVSLLINDAKKKINEVIEIQVEEILNLPLNILTLFQNAD